MLIDGGRLDEGLLLLDEAMAGTSPRGRTGMAIYRATWSRASSTPAGWTRRPTLVEAEAEIDVR